VQLGESRAAPHQTMASEIVLQGQTVSTCCSFSVLSGTAGAHVGVPDHFLEGCPRS
jgi:hypothetical protein